MDQSYREIPLKLVINVTKLEKAKLISSIMLYEDLVTLSYIVLYFAVVHGWVETESQIINTEEKTQ